MDPITGAVATKAIQGLTEILTEDEGTEKGTGSSDFENLLKGIIGTDEANNTNEEELFAALIFERVQSAEGEEAANAYKAALEERKGALARGDGYVNVEQAANEALDSLVESGTLSAEQAGSIRGEAFRAAQLDDNLDALYDGRGSESDATIAVMNMEAALLRAKNFIDQMENGELEPGSSEIAASTGGSEEVLGEGEGEDSSIAPEGEDVDGSGGFLFKPESDSGKLVVLLPSQLAHQVESVVLKDLDGNEVERGNSSGYANPDPGGDREHFRFEKAGAEYPQDIVVEITMADGSIKEYKIPDPSQRYD